MSELPWADPSDAALFTDLYELTMLQSYFAEGMHGEAVFELFFRELPAERNFLLAAGLADVLRYLENLRFNERSLDYLRGLEQFSERFVDRLADLRFTGDVYAMPEGSVAFANEPVVQVVAPLPEAQLAETLILNQVHYQTMAASKALRTVEAAQGRAVVDFASRRAHGVDAALKLARASYLAGFAGTSNVLAGRLHGVPVFGTMAHSFIEAHDREADALEAFAREFAGTTLLIDTYDIDACVQTVIELQRRLDPSQRIGAVRIDSGDLGAEARRVRRRLDDAGLEKVKIFLSGGLDERKIADLVERGDPADGFGVGTRVGVSADVPYYDCAYKLVAYDGEPRMKLSGSSPMLPGRKQVFRRFEAGAAAGDTIALHDEQHEGEPLLRCVMRGGEPVAGAQPTVEAIRRHAADQVDRLSPPLRQLAPADPPYPVAVSDALEAERRRLRRAISA